MARRLGRLRMKSCRAKGRQRWPQKSQDTNNGVMAKAGRDDLGTMAVAGDGGTDSRLASGAGPGEP